MRTARDKDRGFDWSFLEYSSVMDGINPQRTTSLSEKLKLLEAIIMAPVYNTIGYSSERLVYISTVEGAVDVWVLNLENNSRLRLTEGGVHSVASTRHESPYVIYTRDVSKGRELQQVYAVNVKTAESFALEEFKPHRVLGLGFDGKNVALAAAGENVELWLLSLEGSAEKLYSVASMMYVTDFNEGVVVGEGVLKGNPRSFEVFMYDVNTQEFEVYTPREGAVNKGPVTKGGNVLFATNAFGKEQLVIYDRKSGDLQKVKFNNPELEEYDPAEYLDFGWTSEWKIWAIGKKDGRSKLFLDGKTLLLPDGIIYGADFVGSKAYVTHSSLTSPPKVYEVNLSGGYRVLLGTELCDKIAKLIGKSYIVRVKSFDGLEIPTFVVESNASPKPGPSIVYVHGGPWSEVADRWDIFIASLTALGYHVIAPNFRGSTGYGEEFRMMDIGDPGGGDLEDVVKAAEWAINQGLASKIAVMGYSYGGFMTFLSTVKKAHVFNAGVAGAGVADWAEMYELSDAFFRQFIDVLFNGKRELWKERSAINFAEELRVPLCIIHPQNDSRTPLKPVLRYVWKLMELGKTFELHVVPEAGHAITKLENAVKLIMPAVIFLEKYLNE
ncbi:MAG: S9 family peptidase [Thermofilaceae archaeon]